MVSTIFSGLILGSVYTLAAIGLSLQWGVLKNLNFSHGACITLGAYIMWAGLGAKLTYLPAFLVVMVVMFFIGMAIEWTTIRPFFGKEDVEVNIFIATVALSTVIAQIILLVFGGKDKDLDVAFQGVTDFGLFATANHKLFILIIAPIILFAMWLVLNKTKLKGGSILVDSTEIESKVIEIVSEQMGVDKAEISKETSFVNDLNADSLDTVELVMELEDAFDLNIPDEEAEKIQTVGQAIDYITGYLSKQQQS